MADIHTIRAETRDRGGKGPARATRRSGRIPGVLYGQKEPPVLLTLDPREIASEMHRTGFFARLVEVQIDGGAHRVLPRDVQVDPVTDAPLHVDFMRVGVGTRIHVAVPVVFTDQESAPGLKRGGILNIVRHEIDLVCSADNIPDRITVSLDGLDIGDTIHIHSVTLPEGTRPTVSRDFTVASIAAPTAVREEQVAAAAAAAAAKAAAEAAAEAGEIVAPAAPGTPGAAPGATPAAAAAGAPPAAPAKGSGGKS